MVGIAVADSLFLKLKTKYIAHIYQLKFILKR